LFIEIWGKGSAAKGAVAKPPAVLFWSIGSAGRASQVVDFHDNFRMVPPRFNTKGAAFISRRFANFKNDEKFSE
jgi:hypothetical protein